MLTSEKVRIYLRYKGDIDNFSRANNAAEMSVMSDRDWKDIDKLLQRLAVEKTGLAAKSFHETTAELIAELGIDENAVNLLREFEE